MKPGDYVRFTWEGRLHSMGRILDAPSERNEVRATVWWVALEKPYRDNPVIQISERYLTLDPALSMSPIETAAYDYCRRELGNA